MEKKHRKSKRSLKGDDVYEMACRYDVGWSKKRHKNADGTDGRNQVQEVDDASLNSSSSSMLNHESGLSKERKSLDIKSEVNRRKEQQKMEENKKQHKGEEQGGEQDNVEERLHPLHVRWKFTKKQLDELKSKGVKVKMGNWSKQEIDTLEKNMQEYLKVNNIADPAPLILAENGKRGKNVKSHSIETDFYRLLGKGIHRPLFNVYRRVLRMYNPENHLGRWSENDEQELLRFYAQFGDQWTKIGSFLGRSGMSVHHKFLDLQQANEGCWSEDETERLDAAVRASTGTEFGTQIYRNISWVEVADFVITRSADQCRRKWIEDVCWKTASGEKYVKWDNDDDVKLIERLYLLDETDENDINWVLMTKNLPNAPSVTWLRSKWSTLKKAVPSYTECDFEEILDYLYNTHRQFLMNESKDRHS